MPYDIAKAFPGRAGDVNAPEPDTSWLGAMGRLYSATVAENDAVRNTQSSRIMLREAYQRRIDAIKQATGATIANPMDDPNQPTALGGGFTPPRGLTPYQAAVRWGIEAGQLADKFPDQRHVILGDKTVDEEAQDLARQKVQDLDTAAADPRLGGLGRMAASFAGGAVGMVRDPMQAPLMAAGGGFFGAGRTIIGSIARVAASEAMVNAGAEAAVQPFEQSRRAQLGMEHGLGMAAESVAQAAAVGAAFGAGGEAAAAGFKAGVKKLLGARTVADLEAGAKDAGVTLDEPTKALARQAELSDAADTAAFGKAPAGLTPDEVSMLKAQAIGSTEFPSEAAQAIGPVQKPSRPPAVARVIDEAAKGESGVIGGKPVTYASFDPKDIGTDAQAFQYKDGGDTAGVTDRLAGVTRWDPMASGKVFVFERTNGEKIIADGHQRLGLAKRLEAAGQDVKLDGYVFREADGWTVPDVRALAAKKNLQEGSGSAMDAARILRDRPDILDASLPTTGPMIRKAQGLARLSDDAWRMVTNGLVPDAHGALVGEMEANPARHAAILSDLKRYAPDTEREARLLVQEIQQSGVIHEQQTDMFGAFDVAKSLIGERVKVLDQAMQQLRTDKRVFQQLSSNADLIEQAGNSLDRTGNRVRAVSADFVATLIEKMARRKGEMSDLLTDAARAISEGKTVASQSRRFLDDVRDLIERRGFGKLMQEAQAEPVLKPAVAPEPGTAEALRMAEAAAPIARTQPQPKQDVEADFFANLPNRSMDEIYAVAQRHQDELIEAGRELAAKYGAEFKEAKIKARPTAEEKMLRKGYDSTAKLTDIVRGGFVVETPRQADAIMADLSRRFRVLDEGWNKTPAGYVDRKMLVRFEDGTIGEVQFWEPNMLAAKDAEGHKLYEAWRTSKDAAEQGRLEGEMINVYSAAAAKASPDWGNLDKSSGPNLVSNLARQDASDITAASVNTSSASTLDHGAPADNTANAVSGSRESTAGRRSQLQNVNDMGNTSNGDISTGADNSSLSSGGEQQNLWDALPSGTGADGQPTFTTAADMIAEADRTQHLATAAELCTRS